ncbi:MAG: ATP-binding protein, partial [Proteobacteria bacterium]|nr:ATP-binding protein [Pseudomonadota bacterium]
MAIVNDILDLSKIDTGMMHLELIEFDLYDLVLDVSRLFVNDDHSNGGVSLAVFIDAETPQRIRADPTRLRQVLSNLLSNAFKFTSAGHVYIRIIPTATDRLRFEVEDSGIGIATGVMETIFDSFVQADESVTRVYGGTGLGLSLCRHISELMGGSIGVDSK